MDGRRYYREAGEGRVQKRCVSAEEVMYMPTAKRPVPWQPHLVAFCVECNVSLHRLSTLSTADENKKKQRKRKLVLAVLTGFFGATPSELDRLWIFDRLKLVSMSAARQVKLQALV